MDLLASTLLHIYLEVSRNLFRGLGYGWKTEDEVLIGTVVFSELPS